MTVRSNVRDKSTHKSETEHICSILKTPECEFDMTNNASCDVPEVKFHNQVPEQTERGTLQSLVLKIWSENNVTSFSP